MYWAVKKCVALKASEMKFSKESLAASFLFSFNKVLGVCRAHFKNILVTHSKFVKHDVKQHFYLNILIAKQKV